MPLVDLYSTITQFDTDDLAEGSNKYYNDYRQFQARLTLETGVPISTNNQTAKTELFLTPYKGNLIWLYDDSLSQWKKFNLTEISIKTTDTQNGDLVSGTPDVTNLTDTSKFIIGMEVTGTGIPGSTTILSINSDTAITLSNNTISTSTESLTFKVAANTNLDIFCYIDTSNSPKLKMIAWTNDTTRATALDVQDEIDVEFGGADFRYIGMIRTTTTAGELEDSDTKRFVYNHQNKVLRNITIQNSTTSWTFSTDDGNYREFNNGTNHTRAQFLNGNVVAWSILFFAHVQRNVIAATSRIALALDTTTSENIGASQARFLLGNFMEVVKAQTQITIGYHYITLIESIDNASGGSHQIFGTGGGTQGDALLKI